MKPGKSSTSETKFIGGELCLDFTNTVDWHASDSPQEGLKSYKDLVFWSLQAGIMDNPSARKLLLKAAKCPSQAQAVLNKAIVLRESMYRIFVGEVTTRRRIMSDLEIINTALSKALRHLRVTPAKDCFIWEWADNDRSLDCMLWPILRSAADLLTSEKRNRIGQCADDRGCGWLFLDSSKNHSRRWCKMEDCGNRAKALRHYNRKQNKVSNKTLK